ncbi:MAG: hypothetical protein LBO69_01905 [Ignavibacteria bacterium]|jgi:hypothetical protein|nr:hypothetical protein [Ignavibacteria bacterium]
MKSFNIFVAIVAIAVIGATVGSMTAYGQLKIGGFEVKFGFIDPNRRVDGNFSYGFVPPPTPKGTTSWDNVYAAIEKSKNTMEGYRKLQQMPEVHNKPLMTTRGSMSFDDFVSNLVLRESASVIYNFEQAVDAIKNGDFKSANTHIKNMSESSSLLKGINNDEFIKDALTSLYYKDQTEEDYEGGE